MVKGFTLIELLIVIAIVAVLSVVVLLTLNPAELLRQARDSNRISDMGTLKSALALYLTDASTVSMGNGANCYVDVTAATQGGTPTGFVTGCNNSTNPVRFPAAVGTGVGTPFGVTATNQRTNAGSGWLPVNLTSITSGAPIGSLPVDPAQSVTNNLFYAYRPVKSDGAVCATTDCTAYELNANMESLKFSSGCSQDVESTDGGNSPVTPVSPTSAACSAGAGATNGSYFEVYTSPVQTQL